jgi:4-amino-4-deoxy-L-arabinose transferase-like glycosyltransferase
VEYRAGRGVFKIRWRRGWLSFRGGWSHNPDSRLPEDAASTEAVQLTRADAGTGGAERWVLRHLYLLIALIGAVRLVQGAFTELAPDEAVYWMWSRHLAAGYFDHPPMIALLNWVSTHLFGDREIAVRLPALLLAMGTLLLIVRAARMVLRDELAVAVVTTVWVCSPMLAGFGLIFTPDTPATFFSAAALVFALGIASRMDGEALAGNTPRVIAPRGFAMGGGIGAWVGFGMCCGLGLDSKYPVVLLPAAVGASLLCSRKGWRELRRPGPWAAAIVALVIFSPVIWWNWRHHWASFLFQLHHGVGGNHGEGMLRIMLGLIEGFASFVGGQALLWTPILFGMSTIVLWKYWRAFFRLGEVDRLLLLTGSAPLLLFGVAALKSHGEINWPAFAYVPISLLLGKWVADRPATRLGWLRLGWQVALGCTVVIEVMSAPIILPALHRAGVPLPASMVELTGWEAWGKALGKSAGGASIVCNRHQDAAEATFYVPGRPNVWCDSIGTRPAAYDYFDEKPDFSTLNRVLFIGGNRDLFMAKFGYTHAERRPVDGPDDKYHTKTASILSR